MNLAKCRCGFSKYHMSKGDFFMNFNHSQPVHIVQLLVANTAAKTNKSKKL